MDAGLALLEEMEEGEVDEGARGLALQQTLASRHAPARLDNSLALLRDEEDRALRRQAGPAPGITQMPLDIDLLIEWFADRWLMIFIRFWFRSAAAARRPSPLHTAVLQPSRAPSDDMTSPQAIPRV